MMLLLWRVLLSLLLPLLLLSGISYGAEIHVKSADDLIKISNDVNSGTTIYSGTTVFLDNDLDFTGKEAMEPIGKDGSHNFQGTFDGQGHVIRNLKMDVTSSEHVGLFGYSEGLTVKDLVIDSSCSITSSLTGVNSFTGSVIGFLKTDKYLSTIEGVVNMASVTFSGDIKSDLHLGGIVGVAQSTNYDISIRNCANYGTVTHDGVANGYCDIGGIVGHFVTGTKYLQNCINYGAIRHTGSTTGEKFIGGIVGKVQFNENKETLVENCLSVGVIELTNKTDGFIGGIVGIIESTGINITHCFWTDYTGIDAACGRNDLAVDVSDSSLTELNTATLNELNGYAERNGWSRTIAFHLNGGRINNLTQETLIATEYHFPDPVKGDNTFLCWCEDIYCNVKYNTTNPSGASDVYAIWDKSTLSFVYGNRSGSTRTVLFNKTIEYPEDMRREGYTFVGWDPRPERMPGADLTIVALWAEAPVISSSSIEHSSSSSASISSSSSSSIESSSSSSPIISSSSLSATISSSSSSSIESSSSSSPKAFVEIVFGRKDLSREEIERIIKPFTDEDFFIEKIEVDDTTGETTVIVRFKDTEEAENFIETIKASSEFGNGTITSIKAISNGPGSFSFGLAPLSWLLFLVLP